MLRELAAVALLITVAACSRESVEPAPAVVPAGEARLIVTAEEAPALPVGPGAGEPFLFASGGTLTASWLERGEDGTASLRYSNLVANEWEAPVTVASGSDFFVNWADVPSVVPLGGKRMIAHWLQKSGAGTYSYDVRLAISEDGGRTWKEIGSPHATEVDSEYGFVSIEPDGSGGAWIAWLDGREMSGSHGDGGGAMFARVARVTADNEVVDEAILDQRTCECCQTGMTVVDGAPLVVWRDRSEAEIRDNVISRRSAGSWTSPVKLHEDEWKIPGCPVNGPQIASDGGNVVVASFTAAMEKPEVKVVFSDDGGASFTNAVVVSDAAPLGRVDVLARGERAIVTWIEKAGADAMVKAAVAGRDGVEQQLDLGTTSAARSSGFPRAAMLGDEAWIAWTIPGATRGGSRIELARLNLSEE